MGVPSVPAGVGDTEGGAGKGMKHLHSPSHTPSLSAPGSAVHPSFPLHGKRRPFSSLQSPLGKAPLNSITSLHPSPGSAPSASPACRASTRSILGSSGFTQRRRGLIRDVACWPESHLGDYWGLQGAGSSQRICSMQVEGFVTIRLQANRNPQCWQELSTGGHRD